MGITAQKNDLANLDGNLIGEKVRALLMVLCVLAFLVAASTSSGAAQQISSGQLSPEASQVADQIGVTPLLKRLEPLSAGVAVRSQGNLESLAVRQEITEKIMIASLDIDSVNAVIDVEIEQIRGIRARLQAKRDKAQNIINIASILTGGAAGAVTSALQFKSSTVSLGNGIGVGAGVGSVLLSIVGIRTRGGRSTLSDSPRMLARFFGRQPSATETISSVYPDEVWLYLNSPEPNLSQSNLVTRKERLIAKWRSESRINRDDTPKGERKIEFMSSSMSQVRRLNMDELTDRESMLLDVRASVSLMKRELSEILRGLHAPRVP